MEEPDAPCATEAEIDGLRINQLQVVGSHNSYRRRTYAPIFTFVQASPRRCRRSSTRPAWDYDHLPLPEQLVDHRMRALELDVYNDPEGGRFFDRQGLRFVQRAGASRTYPSCWSRG